MNTNQSNIEIRKMIKEYKLYYWEVADKVGISDTRFTVWLRKPLNDERKKRVLDAINELTKEIKAQ